MIRNPFSIHPTFAAVAALIVGSAASAGPVKPAELAEDWAFYGQGEAKQFRDLFYLGEAGQSKGAMIVSPYRLGEDYRLSYDIMPMNAASVLVVYASIAPAGDPEAPPVPEDFDGDLGELFAVTEGVFFAFHNAAHNRTPFAARIPAGGGVELLEEFGQPVMRAGRWSSVEIRKSGREVTLVIDGRKVVSDTLAGDAPAGRLSFRVRGTAGEPASCLIRDVTIE